MSIRFSIYRYNPEQDDVPYMQDYVLEELRPDMNSVKGSEPFLS